MPDVHTDFVIQISTSAAASLAPGAAPESADESRLTRELQRSLQPGAEIVLILGSYGVRTSILWLSDFGQDSTFSAGVRLLGISAWTGNGYPEPPSEEAATQRPTCAFHLLF
jgi:hypothetical protein